ncbi:MAG: NAD-dependent epimerase/dehydratase family protein [Acidobacteria bacterium]|jgi:nucleoside-diphosphate-sugar epimerase|nr:NAD-dependent epimerase/dehydratase family protein [Acidobacteriota bacterium]
MRVFLTGGTGYIGSAVLDALLRAGHDVTALVRNPGAAERLQARQVAAFVGTLADPASYRDLAAGFEAYVHAAGDSSDEGQLADASAVETLGALAADARAVLVYTSGVWVLGPTREPAGEDAATNPIPLVAYRVAREQAVLALAAQGVRAAVIRPGVVFGSGRGIVADMIKDAENGLMRVIGPGENRWPLVYDRDLADLYVRVLAEPTAAGIFHGVDENDETVNEIAEAFAAHSPQRPDVRMVPLPEARKKLGLYADALALDQVVRCPRARALGWEPQLASLTRNVPRLFEEWRNARNS